MHRVLLCMLEAVEGELCLMDVLEVPEVIRCVVLCIVEGRRCVLEVLRVPEVMRCVVLCIVEGRRCLLDALRVPEVMRCVQVLRPSRVRSVAGFRNFSATRYGTPPLLLKHLNDPSQLIIYDNSTIS